MGRRVDVQNASTRARGEYAQALAKIEESGICPFCEEHLPKHHGKPILFSNAHWIVTENAWPYEGTRHQFVLVARDHIESAEALPPGIALDVVCYSMNVAMILSRRPNTQLMLLGGLYHASSATFFSDEALHYLKRLGVDKAFISAGGVHSGRGASCSNFNEVPIKRAAIESADESILVVDESKLGRLKPAFFSPLDAFSRVIVGGSAARQQRSHFKGIKLDVVT